MAKILVVDDSSEIQELLKAVLTLKDFAVREASNGVEGLALALKERPDLIVLDLMLPDMDGFEVCRKLKANSETRDIPVIMLTAKAAVLDRITGLEQGANDYLVKPFDTLELLARIKVQLRQRGGDPLAQRYPVTIEPFTIDPANYRLSKNGKIISDLTPREFDILYILMRNSPQTVPRSTIFQTLGGKDESAHSRVIDIHIAKIRKKIGEEYIITIPGKGYLFASKSTK